MTDLINAHGLVEVYKSRESEVRGVVVIIAIFAPLGTRRYRSMSR